MLDETLGDLDCSFDLSSPDEGARALPSVVVELELDLLLKLPGPETSIFSFLIEFADIRYVSRDFI